MIVGLIDDEKSLVAAQVVIKPTVQVHKTSEALENKHPFIIRNVGHVCRYIYNYPF